MKLKRALLLVFFLLAGAVFGALLASVFADIPALSWLAFSRSIGFNPDAPFVLDLSVFELSFGFMVELSVVQVCTIGLAIFTYHKLTHKKVKPAVTANSDE